MVSVTERSWANCLLVVVVPGPTQPSIHLESVNEDQLQLGRQRQVWFIPFVDKRLSVQVKTAQSLEMRAMPERLCCEVHSLGGTMSTV